jgi:endonuclease YncB( thermonuclease family)
MMSMNRYLGIVLFLVIFPVSCFADQFKCTRVTDGDTINVVANGHKEIIRLVGIDDPETSHKKREPGLDQARDR